MKTVSLIKTNKFNKNSNSFMFFMQLESVLNTLHIWFMKLRFLTIKNLFRLGFWHLPLLINLIKI